MITERWDELETAIERYANALADARVYVGSGGYIQEAHDGRIAYKDAARAFGLAVLEKVDQSIDWSAPAGSQRHRVGAINDELNALGGGG